MKEMYSLFNHLDTNLEDYQKEYLTDLEERKLLNQIRKTKNITMKKHSKKYVAAIVCITLLSIFGVTVNMNSAVYAAAKNIAWQIGEFLGIEQSLQDYTTVLGTSREDKGYTITLNEVILDDNQLVVSSSIQSDTKMSEMGVIDSANIYVNGKRVSSASGGSSQKTDEYTQESVINYELEGVDTQGKLDIEILYNSLHKGEEVIKGDWDFRFQADGAKLEADTKHVDLEEPFILPNGSKVIFTEFTSNNLGQKIYFQFDNWNYKNDPMYDLKLEGTDNLGNQVEFDLSHFNGQNGRLNRYIGGEGIKEGASSFTLTPYAVAMPEESGKMSDEFVKIGQSFTIYLTEK